jgi:hypothetical protein
MINQAICYYYIILKNLSKKEKEPKERKVSETKEDNQTK